MLHINYKLNLFTMKKIFFVLVATVLMVSCRKDFAANSTAASSSQALGLKTADISTTEATYFDSVFTRYGSGWTGGDQAVSYKLPDGRVLWLFGDSFLDTVYPNRTRPFVPFIHNTMVTMDTAGGSFKTYHGGTDQNPLPYFQASGKQYYWPVFAFMNEAKTQVYVFLDKIKPTTGGSFGFEVTGVDVALLNYPDLSLQRIAKFSRGNFINWAGAAHEDDDGYVYFYGTEDTKYNKYIHVARTSRKNPLNKVTFFNGTGWVTDTTQSVRIQGGVSESFSIFKNEGKYYLLSQPNLLSPDIYLWDAKSPEGPYIHKRFVCTTPNKIGDVNIWTYNATVHTEFNQNNQLLVGYCTNAIDGNGLYTNADSYRPYFVWASGWQ